MWSYILEQVSLNTIWQRPDCLGWAWECEDAPGVYVWHNANDMGLMGEIEECDVMETVIKKVYVGDREVVASTVLKRRTRKIKSYIYILKNVYGYTTKEEASPMSLDLLEIELKSMYDMPLTEEEKEMQTNYWADRMGM